MKNAEPKPSVSKNMQVDLVDKEDKKNSYAWERLDPHRVLNDSGSQKLLEIHLDRYRTASEYVVDKKVLDIACGVGYGSQILSQSRATSVVGVDICAETIEYAKETYQGPSLTYVCADAEKFEWPHKFECIVSFETIEHLPHPEVFLSRVRELLIPGGRLLLSAPLGETRHFDPHHLHAFTKEIIFEMLERHGFTIDWHRVDDCFLDRAELLEWKHLYPESSLTIPELLFTWRGWYIIRDFVLRGGFDTPQLLVAAHLNMLQS